MKWFGTFFREALSFIGVIPKVDFTLELVDDHPLPEEMLNGRIYVVGGKNFQKWAYFKCPTNNGDVIQLSLQQQHRPRWSVTRDFFWRPTVHPSIRQLEGSFAHFWIKKGNVEWCADSGNDPILKKVI
jgi:Family of unknown function (DUF6527)